jgi:hypothetical protein
VVDLDLDSTLFRDRKELKVLLQILLTAVSFSDKLMGEENGAVRLSRHATRTNRY